MKILIQLNSVLFVFLLFYLTNTMSFSMEDPDQLENKNMVKYFDASKGEMEYLEPISKSESEWKKILSPEAFKVTRKHGTEPAFSGEYHNKKDRGIYTCIACGIDLFSSDTKYDSKTGWPSYWAPVHESNIGTKEDRTFFMVRTEVHCRRCKAHLGHIFDDGPDPTGKRYCINSAALKFRSR